MTTHRVLFVGLSNSARSQMAEALLRAWGGDRFEAFSAGVEAGEVSPEAIAAMGEIGIDIGASASKTVERYLGEPFDWVITVCDTARVVCPAIPGAQQHGHWGFDDPARAEGSVEERMLVYRRVRTEIAERMRMFLLAAGREDLPQRATSNLGS